MNQRSYRHSETGFRKLKVHILGSWKFRINKFIFSAFLEPKRYWTKNANFCNGGRFLPFWVQKISKIRYLRCWSCVHHMIWGGKGRHQGCSYATKRVWSLLTRCGRYFHFLLKIGVPPEPYTPPVPDCGGTLIFSKKWKYRPQRVSNNQTLLVA